MKKVIFLVSLFSFIGIGMASAQCTKAAGATTSSAGTPACCKSKMANADKKACVGMAEASTSTVEATTLQAALAANPDVEQRVNDQTGEASFWQKSVCAHSGNVSYTQVTFSEAESKFVALQPAAAPAQEAKKECQKKCAKSCSKAPATKDL